MPKHAEAPEADLPRNGARRPAVRRKLLAAFALALACNAILWAAPPDKLTNLRIPFFRDGRITLELTAKTAEHRPDETKKGGAGTLKDVAIFVYEDKIKSGKSGDAGTSEAAAPAKTADRPPFSLKIVSKTGDYDSNTKQASLTGGVDAFRYVDKIDRDTGAPARAEDAHLTCDSATWNNDTRTMTGPGPVKLDSSAYVLTGEDLYYLRGASGNTETLRLAKNVNMLIKSPSKLAHPKDNTPPPENEQEITITCQGDAVYEFEKETVTFSNAVKVSQAGLEMTGDKLRVVFSPGNASGREYDVRQVLVWGSVTVKGDRMEGHGDQALYDSSKNAVIISGSQGRLPEISYAGDRIRDELVVYDLDKKTLTAMGGKDKKDHKGTATFTAVQAGPGAEPTQTVITYADYLKYDRLQGKAVFVKDVSLSRPDIAMQCQALEIELPEPGKADAPAAPSDKPNVSVRRVTATGSVVLKTMDGKIANAAKAELDTRGDMLRLSGEPYPVVADPGKSRIRAPDITLIRIPTADGKDYTSAVRTGGPGEAVFNEVEGGDKKIETIAVPAPKGQMEGGESELGITRVRYVERLDYDEAKRRAIFDGDVVLTRGDIVLHAGQLEILTSAPQPGKENEKSRSLPLERFTARKRVRMHNGGRHSSSDLLVYDIPAKISSLSMVDSEESAQIWEEKGSSLAGRRIISNQPKSTIEVEGPGILTLAEMDALGAIARSARISFDGRLVYEGAPGQPARATFYKGVVLRWQDMVVHGDRLTTDLGTAKDLNTVAQEHDAFGEQEGTDILASGLKRAQMDGHVRIETPGRTAEGDSAIVMRDNSSLSLTGRPVAEMRDERGVRLVSPQFTFFQLQGLVKATGPGKLFIAGPAAAKAGQLVDGSAAAKPKDKDSASTAPGAAPTDYKLEFGKEMAYNIMKRRLVFKENVTLMQETLQGRCDEMEVLLEPSQTQAKAAGSENASDPSLTMSSAECVGNVYFMRFEPPDKTETLASVYEQGSNTSRCGTTVILDADRAFYDVPNSLITFSKINRQVRVLEQVVKSRGADNPPSVSRVYSQSDKAVFNRASGSVTFDKVNYKQLPATGPLRFPEE